MDKNIFPVLLGCEVCTGAFSEISDLPSGCRCCYKSYIFPCGIVGLHVWGSLCLCKICSSGKPLFWFLSWDNHRYICLVHIQSEACYKGDLNLWFSTLTSSSSDPQTWVCHHGTPRLTFGTYTYYYLIRLVCSAQNMKMAAKWPPFFSFWNDGHSGPSLNAHWA